MTTVSEVGYGAYKPAAGETKGANSLEVFIGKTKHTSSRGLMMRSAPS